MKKIKKTIAFGVAGEGRGHASRAIALSENLCHKYRIIIFAPETISSYLLENLPPDTEIFEIPGINFHKDNHIIRYRKTIIRNLTNIGKFQPETKRISKILKAMNVDALISDFEPYTAIAAKSLKLPVLNLNHPGIVLRYFSVKPDALAAKIAAKIMMPPGTQQLICSFYGGDIGPVIRKDIKNGKPSNGNYFVVYTKDETRKEVTAALESFPDTEFKIFPDKNRNFTEALLSCRGVISSSGHQMLSEALYLKKPVLAFPQKMQFEQRLNAIMLERSGWGIHGDLNSISHSVSAFIKNIDNFPIITQKKESFLLNDFTLAAANCIIDFVEINDPILTTRHIRSFTYRANKPVQVKPA